MRLRFLRSLRSRLLLLFAVLAVGPLVVVGIFDYLRSTRLVEQLIIAQTDTIAHRAARAVSDRYALVTSDVLLLSENADVQRLFRELARGDSAAIRKARTTADEYLQGVWRLAGATYYSIELKDVAGATLWRATSDSAPPSVAERPAVIREPVRELSTGMTVGALVLVPRPDVLWPRDVFGPSFGRSGYGAIIDRPANRVVLRPGASPTLRLPEDVFGAHWNRDSSALSPAVGTLRYRERDSTRIASFVSLASPPWTIVSSTAVDEFAAAFSRGRATDVVFLIFLITVVAAAFVYFITRATQSLEQLTSAAGEVGSGVLTPKLPPAGPDEVGTLTRAFSEMTTRLRAMMREIEVSRQLAVVGEFAAQLSHEVRNPLTSLKLDLQGMQRQVRAGMIPESARPSVESSLREVNRLDAVVGGVLELARRPTPQRRSVCLDDVLGHTLGALDAQFGAQGIAVDQRLAPALPALHGDPELLAGMFMNLFINALEMQRDGGRLGVSADCRQNAGVQWIDVSIADDGPGVPVEKREEVFRPFYTSRHDGTGLGLALALRTARDHGGHIRCAGPSGGYRGATFVVSLPVSS